MPRFIACTIWCRCNWRYDADLLLRCHSTTKPNSEPLRPSTIDMGNLKLFRHHKHYKKMINKNKKKMEKKEKNENITYI